MNNRILVVDDDRASRTLIAGVLGRTYPVATAASGEEALALAAGQTPALVLLDIVMPGIDGYETCRRLKMTFPRENIQVIMVSAISSEEEQVRAFQVGADAYLVKPFDPNVLRSQVQLHFRLRVAVADLASKETGDQPECSKLEHLVQERNRQINATQDVAVFALAKLAESRDEDTGGHLIRVRSYGQAIAEYLGRKGLFQWEITEQFLKDLYRSSPLHDIGKVGISDTILFKPGPLTPEEFEIVKMHTVLGGRVLEDVVLHSESGSFLQMAVAIARHHHERFDGTGYPSSLKGEGIPLPARIVALADVFDALTSTRPYKPAYPPLHARRIICQESGTHFDPVIVTAFGATFEEFLAIHDNNREDLAATGWTDSTMEPGFPVHASSQIPAPAE
jgi:putative two-component system response regulator